ncbi:MAG: hypothetical protein ACREPF_01820 [Rhodanobacteraceae bacterium]
MSTVPPIIAISSADTRGIQHGITPRNPREPAPQAAQQFRVERGKGIGTVLIIDGATGNIIQRVDGATWLRVARMLLADDVDGSTFTAVG